MINFNFFSKTLSCGLCLCIGILSPTAFNLNAREIKNQEIKEEFLDEIDELVDLAEMEELNDELDESKKKKARKIQNKINKIGKELEERFWKLVKNHEDKKLEEVILRDFQGVGPTERIPRENEIKILSECNIEEFSLEDVIAIPKDDILTISYKFFYTGTGLTNCWCVSVWKKNHCKQWRLVSHSFSAPILKAPEGPSAVTETPPN
jgi:hypothetical protein